MSFDSVHTFYQEKYAFRENLTDIVIHHLAGDRKVRIKCKDIIRAISLYKNKLAVQLSDKVCVYESNAEEDMDMHFRARKEHDSEREKVRPYGGIEPAPVVYGWARHRALHIRRHA